MFDTIRYKGATGQSQTKCHSSEAHRSVWIWFDGLKVMGISCRLDAEVTVYSWLT